MDTRDALVVDAFTVEPTAGTPVGVVLDGADLAADQRAAVAAELGQPTTAFVSEGPEEREIRVAGDGEIGRGIHVAVAAASALADRGRLDADAVAFDLGERSVEVALEADGRRWVGVDEPDLREAEVSEAEAADALGVDPAAIRDVGADLPLVRASLGRGRLLVPVNFLEHLSGARPDPEGVESVLSATDSDAIYAFTFDTLSADAEIHGLAVGADGAGHPADGEAAACAAAACRRYGAFDGDRSVVRVEEGDLGDRPARIAVRTDDGFAVGGRAMTSLDGTVAVPSAGSDDDIIEA